jgi:5'-nucleotidase
MGLLELAKSLADVAEIWVVAPDRDRSNASHRLTLDTPLRIEKLSFDIKGEYYCTDGTPADCVYLSLSYLLGNTNVELVVSGVNRGLNLADDISYSGTIGAALEAVLLDVPAIAVSCETFNSEDLINSVLIVRELASKILLKPELLPPGIFLNVNVPKNALKNKFKITTVGRRRYSKHVSQIVDPKGKSHFWIGGEPQQHENIPGSDCNVVLDEHMISVTPISVAMACPNSFINWKSIRLPGFELIQ